MEDEKLEQFFRGMKQADEHLVVPAFPRQRTIRKLPVFAYAAALAVVIVAGVYLVRPAAVDNTPAGEITITVDNDAFKSQSLIPADDETLSGWESPTDFLLEDY
jgi:hypothetical protein